MFHLVLASAGRVSPSPSQESLCSSKSDDPGVSDVNNQLICVYIEYCEIPVEPMIS